MNEIQGEIFQQKKTFFKKNAFKKNHGIYFV